MEENKRKKRCNKLAHGGVVQGVSAPKRPRQGTAKRRTRAQERQGAKRHGGGSITPRLVSKCMESPNHKTNQSTPDSLNTRQKRLGHFSLAVKHL